MIGATTRSEKIIAKGAETSKEGYPSSTFLASASLPSTPAQRKSGLRFRVNSKLQTSNPKLLTHYQAGGDLYHPGRWEYNVTAPR
jgi:hypothetical protein